tara:strand:+ start:7119 stop:7313 length:195 start_codon:yes stop_codon:yes gene_type:complete
MKVGDLVKFPDSDPTEATGIVLETESNNSVYKDDLIERVRVYWFDDAELSWEPKKWLKVVSSEL